MSRSKSMTSVARNGRHEPSLQKCLNVVLGDGSTNFLQSEALLTCHHKTVSCTPGNVVLYDQGSCSWIWLLKLFSGCAPILADFYSSYFMVTYNFDVWMPDIHFFVSDPQQ